MRSPQEARQIETILATNDKDLFQLVNDSVKVYSTNKTDLKNPKDPHALLGVEEVTEKMGGDPGVYRRGSGSYRR